MRDWDLFSVLLSLYLITFLQRMLEARGQIKLAQKDLDGLFHNRRVNAAGAALFIGLLPSAAAMLLCGDIVKSATDGYLKPREQAFVTSWFRHIPESSLPTYAGVLLMSTLSAVPLGSFMLGMIVPVLVLFALGYFPALARLPKDTGTPPSQNRLRDLRGLFLHLWTLLLIIVLILALGTPIAFAAMDGGMPLMVFLMCMAHAASQISPTHVCLVVAADYFHITLGELIRRTIPVSLAFCVLMIMYYNVLLALGL